MSLVFHVKVMKNIDGNGNIHVFCAAIPVSEIVDGALDVPFWAPVYFLPNRWDPICCERVDFFSEFCVVKVFIVFIHFLLGKVVGKMTGFPTSQTQVKQISQNLSKFQNPDDPG